MPHAIMSEPQAEAVETYTGAVRSILQAAQRIKPSQTVEPALTHTDLAEDIQAALGGLEGGAPAIGQAQYAAIEAAFRDVFYELISSTTIDEPAFRAVWDLLDIVLIFSDHEWCEPGLVFWLAEETLESQTIDGCHRVFDYLDSRRERMVAKHWKSKYLIMLRTCTDLLRRLSRAEDTVFCGRVFIYLFQSFPLGDKSAVNLRGEYHTENATIFDQQPPHLAAAEASPAAMEVDGADSGNIEGASDQAALPTIMTDTAGGEGDGKSTAAKSERKPSGTPEPTKILTTDELYPIFWSLQESFARPTRLFEPINLQDFKTGLEATLAKFKEVQREQDAHGSSKIQDEATVRAGAKRKREDGDEADNAVSSYNPKYLTNRDLFELEISDLAFRRHVLVQALILTEFLLGQTPKTKARLSNLKNKSVIYDFTLPDAEAEWATRVKTSIAGYLQAGLEGKFYYRMVNTVLVRDRNWVHWKAENCPPFQRPPVAPETFNEVRTGAQRATQNKRLRPTPMSSLDLGFLGEQDGAVGLGKLRDPARATVPELGTFEWPIADVDFDIERENDGEKKEELQEVRASKLWRALRVAAKVRLTAFDAVDDGTNVGALFRPPEDPKKGKNPADADPEEDSARTVNADGTDATGDNGTEAQANEAMPADDSDVPNGVEPRADGGAMTTGDADVTVETAVTGDVAAE